MISTILGIIAYFVIGIIIAVLVDRYSCCDDDVLLAFFAVAWPVMGLIWGAASIPSLIKWINKKIDGSKP